MSLYLLLFAQASAAAQPSNLPSSEALPDIEIAARVRAERIDVERSGETSLTIFAEPGGEPQTSIERNQPAGQSSYRELDLDYSAKVKLEPPAKKAGSSSSDQPD